MSDKIISNKVLLALDFDLLMIDRIMSPARIRKIRKKYGMRQAAFADLLGVIYATYSSWERGVRKPSSPSCALLQIAEKYPAIFLQSRKEIIKNIMHYFGEKPNVV
jgi:DNA-binding transcriptional regulator YiaG